MNRGTLLLAIVCAFPWSLAFYLFWKYGIRVYLVEIQDAASADSDPLYTDDVVAADRAAISNSKEYRLEENKRAENGKRD